MPKPFKPENVASHRQAYKVILADGRKFVNTTLLDEFTRDRYKKHLTEIFDRIGAELGSVEEEDPCQPPSKKTSS